jgi:hypothetical protein
MSDESRDCLKQVAERALRDPEFAQKVLTGEEDYPEIRNAILADLFQSSHVERKSVDGGIEEVKFETRFVDAGPRFGPMGPCYVKYYPKMPANDAWTRWVEMPRLNLEELAGLKHG